MTGWKGFLVVGFAFLSFFLVKTLFKEVSTENLAIYVNDKYQSSFPKKGEALFQRAVCDTDVEASWNNDSWSLIINNLNQKTKCNLYFSSLPIIYNFDYTGGEQTFTTPVSGTYKLETWGAQGGAFSSETVGGYGGYSIGTINLNSNETIYINVGSTDLKKCTDMGSWSYCEGGYNGGGNSQDASKEKWGSGGGATHIATKSGLLSNLNNNKESIIMVAGGGGGAYSGLDGASGGGFQGNAGADREGIDFKKAYGGTQTSAGSGYKIGGFGFGGDCRQLDGINCSGGGAGFYGGAGAYGINGAGGSGYVGNSLLTDKAMYCYNCQESSEESTKTISTTCTSETPTENCSKKGNGYARITLISVNE